MDSTIALPLAVHGLLAVRVAGAIRHLLHDRRHFRLLAARSQSRCSARTTRTTCCTIGVMSGAGLRLFLAGDLMTGRGIDQAMRRSVDPQLHEAFVRDAREYLHLAERAHGPIDVPLDPVDIWGEALAALDEAGPAVRIVNLETAVTDRGEPWPDKGIHYRMHPGNTDCLTAAGIDVCALANNHVLDWGRTGLEDTLAALGKAGIATCGVGENRTRARRPAAVAANGRRVLVFSCAHPSSGVPPEWAATDQRAGLWRIDALSAGQAEAVGRAIEPHRQPGDIAVVSVHVGGNWGYRVGKDLREFARALIDVAGADIVHGHSSHHPRPLEIHDGRLILYGCGDLINDYEGIGGHESFRPDLVAMYFPDIDADGRLVRLEIVPMRLRHFALERAGGEQARWLADTLNRKGHREAARLEVTNAGTLVFEGADWWDC